MKRTYKLLDGKDTSDVIFATTDGRGNCAITIYALPYESSMSLEVTAFNTPTDIATAKTTLSFIAARNITIDALPTLIQADGTSSSAITVLVKNESYNPIVGDEVSFVTTAGVVTAIATTDANGRAVATLTSDRRNTIATVTATLLKDATKTASAQVEFAGVQLTAIANPLIITANGKDSSTISMSLVDGAKSPIVGDAITFLPLPANTFIYMPNSLTNSLGNGTCKVYGTGSGSNTITFQAAGASANVIIQYASNHLIIGFDPIKSNSFLANGTDITHLLMKYLQGDAITPVDSATINVSMTLGNMSSSPVFAKSYSLIPDSVGIIHFDVQNPNFPDSATVFVYAKDKKSLEATNATFKFYFKSLPVAWIDFKATPSFVAINGGKSVLTAIAYDADSNRVANEQLSFNLFNGPGTGEYIDPPMVTTTVDGIATANFVSGSTMSKFHEVGIVASSVNGIKSDTVNLTISGPPARIALGTNQISECPHSPGVDTAAGLKDEGGGTWGLPIGALVGDANGNPVADGTPVNFSLWETPDAPLMLISKTITTLGGSAGNLLIYHQSYTNIPTIGVKVFAECQGLLDSLMIQPLPARRMSRTIT